MSKKALENSSSAPLSAEKSKSSRFQFQEWISGDGGLTFAVMNGIIFLMTNYSGLLNEANPYMDGLLIPRPVLATFIFVQESFFFGLVTIIIIVQAQRLWIKQLFCFLEGICVLLYFTKKYIDTWLEVYVIDGQFVLAVYTALFSMLALYSVGMIFFIRLKEQPQPLNLNINPILAPIPLLLSQPCFAPEVFDNQLKRVQISPEKPKPQAEKK